MARNSRIPARSRRKEREAKQMRAGVILFVIGAAILAAIGGLYIYAGRANPNLAAGNLCPDSGPVAITAVVVDVTDPASRVTQAAIRSRILAAAEELPRFGMLKIFAAGADESALLQPLFAKCNPGTKADVNELTSSPELVQKRYDEGFEAPLSKALDGVLDVPTADASPILEGIQAVTVAAFPPGVAKLPRRLLVASDLIQNSQAFSMYGGPLNEDAAERVGEAIPAQLEGVNVELLMIRRAAQDTLQTSPEFVDFWEGWFGAAGARVRRATPLPGRN
ncbi:hypothetical protein ASE82_08415 [Sphingomonas sp. Leaf230]|uniref:hypothetical protein n=1 Tax=Sphingomonas sp. Leaf230 TaxID=1735694 RepID=UPI0006F8EB92|nr:hypothetical protein [Sphingomonas sp. Leaf230]KQN02372.1 hypothetical protein ASE82_08415 [Sphingomonas sp. Leaf230]